MSAIRRNCTSSAACCFPIFLNLLTNEVPLLLDLGLKGREARVDVGCHRGLSIPRLRWAGHPEWLRAHGGCDDTLQPISVAICSIHNTTNQARRAVRASAANTAPVHEARK